MCVLSIRVPIRKKSGNLFNEPRISLLLIFNKKNLSVHINTFTQPSKEAAVPLYKHSRQQLKKKNPAAPAQQQLQHPSPQATTLLRLALALQGHINTPMVNQGLNKLEHQSYSPCDQHLHYPSPQVTTLIGSAPALCVHIDNPRPH